MDLHIRNMENREFVNGEQNGSRNLIGVDNVALDGDIEGNNMTTTPTRKPYVGILGAGSFGYALAANFQNINAKFCIGTRNPASFKTRNPTYVLDGVEVLSYEETVERCDVLFLCVPEHAYLTVIEPLQKLLAGKIIVDVSNVEKKCEQSNATKLQSMVPNSFVVKALNNISAYHLENVAYGGVKETPVCANDERSKHLVMQIIREMGVNPVDHGLLRSSIRIEQLQLRFFPEWHTAVCITLVTLTALWLYYYLYIFWYKQDNVEDYYDDLLLYIGNRLIGWLMFWLLAITYLPGVLAGFIQMCRGSKFQRFPEWFDAWMRCRKQLGLICLLLAGIHGCASCLMLGSGEAKYMMKANPIPNSKIIIYQSMSARHQASLLFAVLGLALMTIVGITSLPSVNHRMSWSEWKFIQSHLGFLTLVFGFVHVMVYVAPLWDPNYIYGWKSWVKNSRGVFPPAAFVMPMLPLIVIVLRLVLMCPGLSCYLANIRNGKIGYKRERAVKIV